MRATTAARTIKAIQYKPGWFFDAIALGDLDEDAQFRSAFLLGIEDVSSVVLMWYTVDTVDTDRENAMIGYLNSKQLEGTVPLNASIFADTDDLLFHLFQWVMDLEEHEAREFFRCANRDWHAPFHPHRTEGAELWAKCAERAYKTN